MKYALLVLMTLLSATGTSGIAATAAAVSTIPSPRLETLENEGVRAQIRPDGTLEGLEFKEGGSVEEVKFRNDLLAGPAWAEVKMIRQEGKAASFVGMRNQLRYTIKYEVVGTRFLIRAGVKNEGRDQYQPKAARVVLGIDCAMVKFPDWNYYYFPTLLRCEKSHFWGYFMTPKGKILSVSCAQPIASYHINYDESVQGQGNGGHLIRSVSLDILHALPLPERHPQNLTSLNPGEERSWTIVLEPAQSLETLKAQLAARLEAPMIDADLYTLAPDESANLRVWSPTPITATATSPEGKKTEIDFKPTKPGEWVSAYSPKAGPGLYALTISNGKNYQSEASLSVRRPWSWYMNQARKESLRHKQYASSHLEQWLGLTTGVLARLRLPDAQLDPQSDQRLREILACQWNLEKKTVKNIAHAYRHFSNTAQMAGLLSYRYRVDHDPYWLDLASGFASFCGGRQSGDGNYVNYTSVFYPAKSILLVAQAEKNAPDERYRMTYERHYKSARKAMDFLVAHKDNLKTEGQNTFEDAMISCSGMQLGFFALLQTDPEQRQKYADAAREMLIAHRCLEQLLIPDSRMNGATLRFWEAQYDTLLGGAKNMMNSPHGWSAWVIPGLWYQYLLTGEEQWLRKTMNAMGSCAQLIDSQTGELRWAFVPDPYREVTMLEPDPANPKRGKRVERIIGETYVPMIAAFHYPAQEPVSGNSPLNGWSCANDVHEIFIALEEVALTSAYVIERPDGTWGAYNCKVSTACDGVLVIEPAEPVVSRAHLNLRNPRQVRINMVGDAGKPVEVSGMKWIGPGGVPEIFR